MDRHFPISSHVNDTTRSAGPFRHALQRGRHPHLRARRRRSVWLLVVATVALLGLLLVFQDVVRGVLPQSAVQPPADTRQASIQPDTQAARE